MSTQIIKPLKGMQKLGHKWAGTDPEKEKEDDDIAENGTDYVAKAYGGAPEEMAEEEEEVEEAPARRRPMPPKAMAPEGGEVEEEEEEDVEEGPPPGMEKSFIDRIIDNDVIMTGIEQSPFLANCVKSISLSFDTIESRVVGTCGYIHNDHFQLAKSLDETFNVMGSRLGIIDTTAGAVDMQKSVGGTDTSSSRVLQKGEESQHLTKTQVLGVMEKAVAEGKLSTLEVIKFEQSGELSPNIQKSLGL